VQPHTFSPDVNFSVQERFARAKLTLRVLMRLLNLDYFFERISERYSEQCLGTTIKLLLRCKQMYDAIDTFRVIFRLCKRKEVIHFHMSSLEVGWAGERHEGDRIKNSRTAETAEKRQQNVPKEVYFQGRGKELVLKHFEGLARCAELI